ncbi:hypothetical protein V2J09_000283 [Rumex salicifolius]
MPDSKMLDQQVKVSNRSPKNQDNKKASRSCNTQGSSKKQSRKGDNPTRFTPVPCQSSNHAYTNTRVCSNLACKAVLSMDKSFCQSCSCCFCHKFDDDKDPSLWLVCKSDSPRDDSCGLSCHIECAFQHEKVGVVNLGQFMQLDGNYWCSACGNVSDILGCWKKQLCLAKDAPRVNELCRRIFLSYRLLNGSSRFKALHESVKDLKSKLEDILGPINEFSHTIGQGTVIKLRDAVDVQKLCADAIAKADEWVANASKWAVNSGADPLSVSACRFRFEDVTSSSVTVVLIEIPTALTEYVKGYKLWYWRTRHESSPNKPVCSFSRERRRIVINDLLSCTEYTFRIVPFTESHDLGNSEAICSTKSLDINCKNPSASGTVGFENKNPRLEADKEQCHGVTLRAVENKKPGPVPRELDLNVALVPDLNEEVIPVFESSGDEDNGYSMENRAAVAKSQVEATTVPRKRSFGANDETFDCDSTLVNGSPFRTPVPNFEGCVKTIRWLECKGHIKQDFRLKFLTWFSLGSTEQERQVVHAFIRTLSDEPKSLAGQLVDSFADIITIKRPRHSYSEKGKEKTLYIFFFQSYEIENGYGVGK